MPSTCWRELAVSCDIHCNINQMHHCKNWWETTVIKVLSRERHCRDQEACLSFLTAYVIIANLYVAIKRSRCSRYMQL